MRQLDAADVEALLDAEQAPIDQRRERVRLRAGAREMGASASAGTKPAGGAPYLPQI